MLLQFPNKQTSTEAMLRAKNDLNYYYVHLQYTISVSVLTGIRVKRR